MECPQCRSVVSVVGNDPSSLPTVFFINGLIEVCEILKKALSNEITCQSCSEAKSTFFCYTCGFVCTSCTNVHKKLKIFEGHKTVPLSKMREGAVIQLPTKKSPSPCQKHEGELCKFYCFECEQFICHACALVDHAGHKFDFARSVADAFREEVLSSLVPLRDIHARVTAAIARVENSKQEITNQGENIVTAITQSFGELRAILNNHEHILLQQAQEIMERKVNALDSQHEDFQLALSILDSLVGFVERTEENASDEEFISMKEQMTRRIQQVYRKYQDVKCSPNEVANTFIAVPPPTSLADLCKKSCLAEVDGQGLESATTNQVSKFTVHTYDTHSQPTSVQQHISAELKSLVDGSVLQGTVVSQTPSMYEVSYTPTIRGRHQLTVQVNNTEIETFHVLVQHLPTQLGVPVRVVEGVKPYYVTFNDKEELFITEHWEKRYTVLDAQGQRVLTVGSWNGPPFNENGWTTGIATDDDSNVYVASRNHKVLKLNRGGEVVKSVGKEGGNVGEFSKPWGVRYHNHQVYVCDCDNGRVQVFDSNLNFVRSFGTLGDGPGQLEGPVDIDFDTQGNIFIADCHKCQVLVFSKDGQYLRHFSHWGRAKGELNDPKGLRVIGEYVYVSEECNHRVSVFRTSGEFVYSFGKRGHGSGEFWYPRGLALDQDGFVFVCDHRNCRIQVF